MIRDVSINGQAQGNSAAKEIAELEQHRRNALQAQTETGIDVMPLIAYYDKKLGQLRSML